MPIALRRLSYQFFTDATLLLLPPPRPTSMIGMGRVFIHGSGIGSETSMVAANDRATTTMRTTMKTTNSMILNKIIKKQEQQQQQHRTFSSGTSTSNDDASSSSGSSSTNNMADEYGEMTDDGYSYNHPTPFRLESGDVLPDATLRYQTYGELNERKDNVLVICHALTGNASLHTWWGSLLGPSLPFDTDKYYIICANILGSCYGSTSPRSINPRTNSIYANDFPDVTVRDSVRLQLHLLQSLGITSVKCVIGGSFGGMQAVEYAALAGVSSCDDDDDDDLGRASWEEKDGAARWPFVRSVIPIACGARHTAWQIAISEVQRQAIYADPKWNNGNVDWNDLPLSGLSVARMLGMVSYRTPVGYEKKFGRRKTTNDDDDDLWEVRTYLEYQGSKFLTRFDPLTYVKLTEQMDTHDVGRGREGGAKEALERCEIPALVLGIDSDVLYPLREQEELVGLFRQGKLRIIKSDAGHDGFLLEQDQVGDYIVDFLNKHD